MTLILPGNDRPPPPPATPEDPRAGAPFGTVLDARGDRSRGAGGFLADMTPLGHSLTPSSQADVFNADGFFQGPTEAATARNLIPVTNPASSLVSTDFPPVAAATTTATALPIVALTPASGAVTLAASLPGIIDPTKAMPHPTMSASWANVTLASNPVTHAPTGAPGAGQPSSDDADIGAGRHLFTRLLAERGATLATRVAVTAVEQGIQVSIRVDRLDPQERIRLRDRVVALLSRHGMGAQSVNIAGIAKQAPPPRSEKE